MSIRSACAAAILAGSVLVPGSAAAQVIFSINHVVTDNLPHGECMRRADATLRTAGWTYFDKTSEAVWATTRKRQYMASIYCLTTRDVAVITAAGPDSKLTHSMVEELIDEWKRTP